MFFYSSCIFFSSYIILVLQPADEIILLHFFLILLLIFFCIKISFQLSLLSISIGDIGMRWKTLFEKYFNKKLHYRVVILGIIWCRNSEIDLMISMECSQKFFEEGVLTFLYKKIYTRFFLNFSLKNTRKLKNFFGEGGFVPKLPLVMRLWLPV